MAKITPHIDYGSSYILLSRLPFDQALALKSWIPDTSVISLRTANGWVSDAVQYSEYEYWFDYQYLSSDKDFEV
jgi:hypothetical protein